MIILRILLFVAGMVIVLRTLLSAVLTFVVPRALVDKLTRWIFLRMRALFIFRTRFVSHYEDLDRVWALFTPMTLLMLPVIWIVLVGTGYALMFWAIGVDGWRQPFSLSGSSLLTLGFTIPANTGQTALAFSEAVIGLGLIAILIAYLPTIYSSWSQREILVTLLEVRAGTPPSPVELFRRHFLLGRLDVLNDLWKQWEVWFAQIEETHTSLAPLALLRSSQSSRSWVVAGGAVLDAAALYYSTLDIPRDPQAALVIRGGTLAFGRICSLFRLPYNPDPHYPQDSIGVTREEWDVVYDQLAAIGLPMAADREKAWLAFAGWRVNYDVPLRNLCGLTLPLKASWSSDRAISYPYSKW